MQFNHPPRTIVPGTAPPNEIQQRLASCVRGILAGVVLVIFLPFQAQTQEADAPAIVLDDLRVAPQAQALYRVEFAPNSAALEPAEQRIVDQFAAAVGDLSTVTLVIKANLPLSSNEPRSRLLRLGQSRVLAVRRRLMAAHIHPARIHTEVVQEAFFGHSIELLIKLPD